MRNYLPYALLVIVTASGCSTTDNEVGSLGKDASFVGDAGQGALDTPVPSVDVAGMGAPDVSAARADSAPDSPASVKDAILVEADAPAVAGPDASRMSPDAANTAFEAGTHQCQVNADGTCQAVTTDTACTPFTGRLFNETAGCYSTASKTLWCCASAAGDSCGWPAATGCLQVAGDGGSVTFWTPSLVGPTPSITGGQACSQALSAKVSGASVCAADSAAPDALPDSGAGVSDAAADVGRILPACNTDDDCCTTVDTCMGIARLTNKNGDGLVPGTQPRPEVCLPCIPPAVQVRCQSGFCIGTKISGSGNSSLINAHCGTIPLDAGAPASSNHAMADGGVSYQTSWTCGS